VPVPALFHGPELSRPASPSRSKREMVHWFELLMNAPRVALMIPPPIRTTSAGVSWKMKVKVYLDSGGTGFHRHIPRRRITELRGPSGFRANVCKNFGLRPAMQGLLNAVGKGQAEMGKEWTARGRSDLGIDGLYWALRQSVGESAGRSIFENTCGSL